MEHRDDPVLRMLGQGYSVLTASVRRLERGQKADLFAGRSPQGQALFFVEDSRCRWLLGDNPDVTRAGFERWGGTRQELFACVENTLGAVEAVATLNRIRTMLIVAEAVTGSTTTSPGCAPSRCPG